MLIGLYNKTMYAMKLDSVSNVFTLWMHFKLALCIAQYLSNPSLIVNSCSIKACNIYPTILHAFKTEFYMIIELEE